jgi:hypothetical protein
MFMSLQNTRKSILISVACLIASSSFLFSVSCAETNNKYPETAIDKKMERMGSVFGEDGLSMSLSSQNKASSKSSSKPAVANRSSKDASRKLLWQAAIEYLSDRPIISTDYNGGSIVTDWHSDDNRQETKVIVLIHEDEVLSRALTVKAYSRIIVKNVMKNKAHQSRDINLESQISEAILSKIGQ